MRGLFARALDQLELGQIFLSHYEVNGHGNLTRSNNIDCV